MWLIEDISGRLPLFLNGAQVSRFSPKNGDSLKLGEFTFFLNDLKYNISQENNESVKIKKENTSIENKNIVQEEESVTDEYDSNETSDEVSDEIPELDSDQEDYGGSSLYDENKESSNEYDEYNVESNDESENIENNEEHYSETSLDSENEFQDDEEGYNEVGEFSSDDSSEKTDPFGSFLKFELLIQRRICAI